MPSDEACHHGCGQQYGSHCHSGGAEEILFIHIITIFIVFLLNVPS
jgi:hypothetical protein